jgi:hypothetical protein
VNFPGIAPALGELARAFALRGPQSAVGEVPRGLTPCRRPPQRRIFVSRQEDEKVSKQLIITLSPLIISLILAFFAAFLASLYLRARVIKERLNTIEPGEIEDNKQAYYAKFELQVEYVLKHSRWLFWTNALLAVISTIAAGVASYIYFHQGNGPERGRLGNWHVIFDPTTVAHAQTLSGAVAGQAGVTTPVQPFLGYMLSAILIVLLVVFLVAVIAVLALRDVPENLSRRTAANDIVKTFGGFFIGVLTSFLKQAIGG